MGLRWLGGRQGRAPVRGSWLATLASAMAARGGGVEVSLPPGSGAKLSQDVIAVTLHRHIGQVRGAGALIHLQPVRHDIALLSLDSLGHHREVVSVWQTPPTCSYAVRGVEEDPSCIEAVTRLVEARACQGQAPEEERPTWTAPADLLDAAAALAARGAIARANEGNEWQLTRPGVQSLSFLLRLHSPEPVDAPRRSARAVGHMTRLELWRALEAGGWSCRPAVSKKRRPGIPSWDLRLEPDVERVF